MSTIGTLICGSSSRGMVSSATRPAASAASRNSGVSGERIVARVSRPERPSLTGRGRRHGCTSTSPALTPERISSPSGISAVGCVLAALHRHLDRVAALLLAQADIVEAEPGGDELGRDHVARARAGADPDPHAVADEEVAEIGNLGVGDDAAVLDLRIDQGDRAGGALGRAELGGDRGGSGRRASAAAAWRSGMRRRSRNGCSPMVATVSPFSTTDARGQRHRQHAPGDRRQHRALVELLLRSRRARRCARAARWWRPRPRCAPDRARPSGRSPGGTACRRASGRSAPGRAGSSRPAICASSELSCSSSFSSPTTAMTWPCFTASPWRTDRLAMVPPMRVRAGTTLGLSTVANTAFSSAICDSCTSKLPAAPSAASAARVTPATNARIRRRRGRMAIFPS